MDKEDLKKSICINLRCVTQSSKGGVPLNQLQNDYKQLLGTPIPFKDLGYNTLENFLCDIPDVVCLKKNVDGSLIVEGVADTSTAHIAKLISKQKPSKKSKSGSAKVAVVTRKWGGSMKKNSHQNLKSPMKDFNSFPPSTLVRKHDQESKLMHLTIAQQQLKQSVLVNLRSVVQSCKDGVPLNRLQKDYRKFIGSNIPFENLGYSTLYEFVQSIPDVINIKKDVNDQFIAIGVVDERTAHLFGNPLKPKPLKTVTPSNELSKPGVDNSTMLQNSSEQKAESPSFFKLPQDKVDLSDLNSILKHSPAQKKAGKKNYVTEVLSKNKEMHASKEEIMKTEPLEAAKPVISCKDNSAPEVPLSCQNQNKILEKIQNQIQIASLSPLVWMHFILYGPSKMATLRKKVSSFYGFPFSSDSKEWEEKVNLLSLLPKKALYHCLYLLGIEYDTKDTKTNLQHKLIDFLAAYTEESGTNMQETVQRDNEKELSASTLTLSSVTSDILSKCSSYVDTETSDAVLSDKNIVVPKTKYVSDSDSDLIELPLYKQSLLKNSSYCPERIKKPVQVEQLNDRENLRIEMCEGIQSEKIRETKHSINTKSEFQKLSTSEKITSVLQKQQLLDKNLLEKKIDIEESSKTETSSLVSSKSAKRNRRRKRKKIENAQKNSGSSTTKPVKVHLPWWQIQQMIKYKKEKRKKKALLASEVEIKTDT
ncbi:Tudor domain-containing protein 7A [Argiope bruennichi]|uniref:Tudor domain-containing protein 7A n=1 Tax=Argiope bruennichi TaxID=94029 RepID=A0A8T0FM24_ARGBR|nr:Tudor domain-containing protein 7A [Argiope bruennichi]